MKEFTLKDVTYDFKLDKKYNFTTIFDEPISMCPVKEQLDQAPTGAILDPEDVEDWCTLCYKSKNLTATRANNLIDGKEEK